jgi:hypothetical protein
MQSVWPALQAIDRRCKCPSKIGTIHRKHIRKNIFCRSGLENSNQNLELPTTKQIFSPLQFLPKEFPLALRRPAASYESSLLTCVETRQNGRKARPKVAERTLRPAGAFGFVSGNAEAPSGQVANDEPRKNCVLPLFDNSVDGIFHVLSSPGHRPRSAQRGTTDLRQPV